MSDGGAEEPRRARRLTYANVVATLALWIACAGVAGGAYVVHTHSLRGPRGARGLTGSAGPAGSPGARGPKGTAVAAPKVDPLDESAQDLPVTSLPMDGICAWFTQQRDDNAGATVSADTSNGSQVTIPWGTFVAANC